MSMVLLHMSCSRNTPDLVICEKDGEEYQRVHYDGLIGVLVK